MTSKEALQDLFTISNKITKDKLNLDTKEIFERYKVIREDLAMLEIVKKFLLNKTMTNEEYEKFKEWLNNENDK